MDEHGDVISEGFKIPFQGADTGLWAATSPLLDDRGGLDLEDCDITYVSAPGTAMAVSGRDLRRSAV